MAKTEYEIDLNSAVNFAPKNDAEEIIQNVKTIINTRLGNVPLDRNFGLSWDYLGLPIGVAKDRFKIALYDALEAFEPRAEISKILFEDDEKYITEGILKPRIFIFIEEQGV